MLLFHEFIFAIHFTSCLKQYLKNKKLKTKLWSTKLFGELWNKINSSRSPIFSLKRFNEAVIEVKYWVRYLNFIDLFYEQIKFVTKSVQFWMFYPLIRKEIDFSFYVKILLHLLYYPIFIKLMLQHVKVVPILLSSWHFRDLRILNIFNIRPSYFISDLLLVKLENFLFRF